MLNHNGSNLFIIGGSQTGKTTLAQHLAAELGWKHVGASEWVRSRFPPDTNRSVLTDASFKALHDNPRSCVDFIRRKYPIDVGGFILEGFRNPFDVARLWRENRDHVILLSNASTPKVGGMDTGLLVINDMVVWAHRFGMCRSSMRRFNLLAFDGLDVPVSTNTDHEDVNVGNMKQLFSFARSWVEHEIYENVDVMFSQPPSKVHVDIQPFEADVQASLLFRDENRKDWLPATVFGVSSYPECAPTFAIMVDGSFMFSYVPPTAVRMRGSKPSDILDLKDLVYKNCPAAEVSFTHQHFLATHVQVHAFFKRKNCWMSGKYLGTLDWYTDNELMHLVALANGQIAFVPNHKIVFGEKKDLPPFRAFHGEWKV